MESPITSCDYLARSLVPGGWSSYTNVDVGEMRGWRRGNERLLTLKQQEMQSLHLHILPGRKSGLVVEKHELVR